MNLSQEILLIIIGAGIGFLSSIGTTVIIELLKQHGKVKVYYKFVSSKIQSRGTWGFYNGSEGMVFEVPLWIEIQNTSNIVRVIRDMNIILSKNGKVLCQMVQMNKFNDEFYGNEGAYSFVIQPRSLNKYGLHFLLKKNSVDENLLFDEIKLRYFDEKDKVHIFPLSKVDKCWELGASKWDGQWKLAKK